MSRLISPTITRTLLALAVAAVGATASARVARAATDGPYQDVYYVTGCASSTADIFSPSYYGNMAPNDNCPSESDIDAPNPGAGNGNRAEWSAVTPSPAIGIIGVTSTGVADCNLHSDGFQADYFYGAGDTNYGVPSITVDCHGATNQNGVAGDLNEHIQSSQYFGWQASCTKSTCTPTGAGIIVFSVTGITLEAQETSGPALTANASNNLYYQSAWVRGTFPADLSASDPSGVCSMQTTVNGRAINSYTDPSPDTSQWSQCPGSDIDASVDTTTYPNGASAITLDYSASNAAGAVSSAPKAINVDNITPSVSLSAPPDTASTSGTEDVTATGSAGPSGVATIYCSVDGGPVQTYPGASAQIPVSGIGSHQVACYDRNRAVDSSGATAISPTQTLGLSIRQPTAAGITFARIADALRCRRTIETITLAGRLHRVRRHGKIVLVRGRPRKVRRHVRRCHARTVLRTVSVVLKRHGRPVLRHGKPVRVKRRERKVVLPHAIEKSTLEIGHGKTTTVSGLVELADGTALAGQPVQVLSAPGDGDHQRLRGVDGAPVARPVATDRGHLSRQRDDRAGRFHDGELDGAGTDRIVDLAPHPAVAGSDPAARATGRRLRPPRRRRAAADGALSRRQTADAAVSTANQPSRTILVHVELSRRPRSRVLSILHRHHRHRVRLPMGGGLKPHAHRDLRQAHPAAAAALLDSDSSSQTSTTA